ncbi:hypothetical protein PghCCS26_47670 [Paenibacillus glycanilyticus]|uniref:Uncharacterized protein n=1 Tax=Paenibacillus glycanilyticus TaxID=126569 RepID=A0ABQ6NRA6_9BACL|nr:hypothetical protein [Paenibacillus glycanilyticus]GMK47637.1 hypothetical protein PghCCS26_47670 [Paenibacillus glycanilyticus]
MLNINIITYITAAVALYGAALGTYNTFVLRREKVKRLRLSLSIDAGDDYALRIKVKVLNIGLKEVIIKKIGVITADQHVIECFTNEPIRLTQEFTLEEGRSISAVRKLTEIDHDKTSLTAFCEDTIGKRYLGVTEAYEMGALISQNK